MTTQVCPDRNKMFTKIHGQLAFLDVAFTALKHVDIGEKILTQMHRGITAIRGTLRQADSPELEAFVCDFEDLLNLICAGEIKLTPEMIRLVQNSTQALARGVDAIRRGETGAEAVQETRCEVFSILLENAVKVKR